jgi:hypothetical protein
MATGGRIIWNDPAFNELLALNGPVGRLLARCGEIGAQGAKRRAPTSADGSNGRPSGYGRSQIGWVLAEDAEGPYVEIRSPALTPTGFPYMWAMEVGTVAHVIRSKGPYPLRNRKTGQVFGPVVHHPGTDPIPHLRPALDDIRAALNGA